MSFKTGLLVGLAVGYYYGAKAGRQRYEKIDRYLRPIRQSDAYQQLAAMTRDLAGQSVEASRQAVREAALPEGTVIEVRRTG